MSTICRSPAFASSTSPRSCSALAHPGAGRLRRRSHQDREAGHRRPVALVGRLRSRRPATTRSSLSLNRNKHSMALDLRRPRACEIVLDLIDDRRCRRQQLPPGVMERMGFGCEELKRLQPAADLCRRHRLRPDRPLSAQGRPGRAGPGHDRASCAASRTTATRRRSMRPPLADYSAGMHLVQGVLAGAAGARARPARGQRVDVIALQHHARHADAGSGDAH